MLCQGNPYLYCIVTGIHAKKHFLKKFLWWHCIMAIKAIIYLHNKWVVRIKWRLGNNISYKMIYAMIWFFLNIDFYWTLSSFTYFVILFNFSVKFFFPLSSIIYNGFITIPFVCLCIWTKNNSHINRKHGVPH